MVKHLGRPVIAISNDFTSAYHQWKAQEITAVKAMELSGLSKATFYRNVHELSVTGRYENYISIF